MSYADYLRQSGVPLFSGAGTYWQIYGGALIPASPVSRFVDMDVQTSRRLLNESKAYLMRWSSDPSSQETPWWWIVCDKYDLALVSGNTRSKIRRGQKKCVVRRVSAAWFAESGYECYNKAFSRYHHATPTSKDAFRSSILLKAQHESLFEYWGAFVEEQLVGYVECVVEEDKGVATTIIKYDPDYLRYYTSYAMMDTLLSHYVVERTLPISNGNRSISHDTNIQDFLLKFGFRRQYCRLNVQYRRFLELAILLLRPFRKLLPGWAAINNVKALLFQEELRRACH